MRLTSQCRKCGSNYCFHDTFAADNVKQQQSTIMIRLQVHVMHVSFVNQNVFLPVSLLNIGPNQKLFQNWDRTLERPDSQPRRKPISWPCVNRLLISFSHTRMTKTSQQSQSSETEDKITEWKGILALNGIPEHKGGASRLQYELKVTATTNECITETDTVIVLRLNC